MTKIIMITTSQNITYRYYCSGQLDVTKYIKLVMHAAKCPARSIVKIVIDNA